MSSVDKIKSVYIPNLSVLLGTQEFSRCKLAQNQPCHEILRVFLNRGFKGVDTALTYGDGKSAKIIGDFIAASDVSTRSSVSLHIKVNPWAAKGLKHQSVLEQVAISLASLQTSNVDVLYLHAPDHNTPIEETLAAVQLLYEEGKFKEFGLSNYASWQVADIYHICKRSGWVLPTVYQGMYNAITRMVEGELFPALRHFGLHFYAYNPLACGVLAGTYTLSDLNKPRLGENKEDGFYHDPKWTQAYKDRYFRVSVLQGIELVRKALDEVYGTDNVSMASASLRWLNHHSLMKPECNDGILIGGDCLEHFVANMDACEEGPLDQRVVDAFEKAWDIDKSNCATYFR